MAQETRDKILDAASRLFAASDSRGASLRAIARAAGVNSALIHYHFGSREGLFEAAVLRALEPIQRRRGKMIQTLRERNAPPTEHELAQLFVEPLVPNTADATHPDCIQLRLLARAFSEQRALVQDLTVKHFGDLMIALGDLLHEALPLLPLEIKQQRMRFCVQAALETLSGAETERLAGDLQSRQLLIEELIDFLAGGLAAPIRNLPT